MRIKIWGARGSTPALDRGTSRYGGNTTCVEIRLADGTLVILDCGSGMRVLGKKLLEEFGSRPIHGYVFLTHFHWDHIQGIPFFAPLYRAGNTFNFYSVLRKGSELKATIEGQMINPYFPVDMGAMASSRHFHELDAPVINVNGARISWASLNHPQGCVGYRVEGDGSTFVLATDTEPGSPVHDRAVRELAQGADILAYDAQYTPEQLQGEKKGWGHSSWAEAIRIARESRVRHLVLFHHDPDSDDLFIDGLVERARMEFPAVTGAAEGLEIKLPERELVADPGAPPVPRGERRYKVELPIEVRWKEQDGRIDFVRGTTRNVSRSGIYFVVPESFELHQPLMLELVLPDEITHRGDLAFKYVAKPLRQERVTTSAGSAKGVGARLEAPPKGLKAPRSATVKRKSRGK